MAVLLKLPIFLLVILLLCLSICSCDIVRNSSKYQFNEGYYRSRLFHKKRKKVYVVPGEDSIKVYSAKSLMRAHVDTVQSLKIAFPSDNKPREFESYLFKRPSFDIDVLTILFKYRPRAEGFPRQFNTYLNGGLYLGFRNDYYKLSYHRTPLRVFKRSTMHFGYSIGAFGGMGMARIDEFNTNNRVSIEYDGTVAFAGLAAILGVDKLSFGLTLGADRLLDGNRRYWVNEGRPWFGLSVGLNLN